MKSSSSCTVFIVVAILGGTWAKYEPTWESLDARPLPQWYDDAKIGIFIHFGVYAVPGYTSEWFWCFWQCPDRKLKYVDDWMKAHYAPGFTYQDFAKDFTLEFFDATEWVNLFEKSGAKYAVLTSKHHEGYTLWPSKHSFSWNSMDVGPKRDVVGEFSAAMKKSSLRLGLYHSLFEWFNPLYLADQSNNFTTTDYPDTKGTAELYELVNTYEPELIWSDGDSGPVEYWKSREFLTWLYNDSPVKDNVVVNDRWGTDTHCQHGGFLNCHDRYNPGSEQTRKWENAMTLDRHSWGNRKTMKATDVLKPEELLETLAQTISNGGNILINVGPTKEGVIPPILQERLYQMGGWLRNNGEAIYSSKKWTFHNETNHVYYTASSTENAIYAIFFQWPVSNVLDLTHPVATVQTKMTMLGSDAKVGFQQNGNKLSVILPNMAEVQSLKHAWTIKITYVKSQRHPNEIF